MNFFKSVFFILMILVLGIFNAFAGGASPPSPVGRRRPPPPPGLAVDDNLYILVLIAIFMGIYIIYNFKIKQKTPM